MGCTEHNRFEQPWVVLTAQQIDDPVGRLRFLKAVASREKPAKGSSIQWKSRRIKLLAALFLFLALGLAFSRRVVMAGDRSQLRMESARRSTRPAVPTKSQLAATPQVDIWKVESTAEFDSYSNGLRIDNRYAIGTRPRSYLTFPTAKPDETRGEPGSLPVGIVFHTTESLQAPFEASQNAVLKQVGESLAEFVRRRHSYNFLIDRFGRVFRVVQESDTADHAGHSVWANEEHFYVNLNESFLGVSFEARTLPGQEEAQVTPAQLRAAAMLTEMLRSRYKIPASNCVTHAQVSVNPANMQVGYHTDWASSFPFESVGLPDNYGIASPALWMFGFEYDASFAQVGGARLQQSAEVGESLVGTEAAAEGVPLDVYRRRLQKRFRALVAVVRHGGAPLSDVE